MTRIVLIGPSGSSRCQHLAELLRRRGLATVALPAREAPLASTADMLFRRFTGMIRRAALVAVSSDVADQPAVVGWVLDQAGGSLVYLRVEPESDGLPASRPAPPGFDLEVPCPAGGVAAAAATLESFLCRPAAAHGH